MSALTKDPTHDLLIIGSGGAAFGAALHAAAAGASVAMIERGTLGGTCVNIGCVPSKTLLRAAEALHRARRTPFAGIEVTGQLTDFAAVVAQKDSLVQELRSAKYAGVLDGLENVELVRGHARFVESGRLSVSSHGDASGATRELRANRVVVATGARAWAPPIAGLADAGYLTSTSALALRELPKSMIVLGGRYIALELAQIFGRFGTEVTVLQRSRHIVPTEDDAITDALTGYLRDDGLTIETSVAVQSVRNDGGRYLVSATVAGEARTFESDQLLVATGRRPNTDDLGLETIGVELDGRAIKVDDFLQSTAPGVYAAGDVIGDPAFVYTAAWEGKLAAENALADSSDSRIARAYGDVPWVMFTDPQLSGVGLSEKRAAELGIAVDVVRLGLENVPRAIAARDTRGVIQLVKEKDGERLLGATIVAPEAGEMIMEPSLAIRYRIPVKALAGGFHPYLTQAEGIKLAAQTFAKDVKKLSCCAA